MSGESWWLICVLPGWRIWRNSSHNCVPILLDKTVPVFMLLRWMCKGLGALIFPFCDQVIYFESFETQKIICHHFCFGGDESGDHRTSAYSGEPFFKSPYWFIFSCDLNLTTTNLCLSSNGKITFKLEINHPSSVINH